jgi:ABC-2 type transport system permease protein
MIVVVFYGADLVWRDREARFQEMLGSSPAPNWVFVLSKMVAAILVVIVFLLTTVVVAILFQAFNGYTNFEFDQYLIRYFYAYGTLFYLVVVLSVAVQIILPNKYFGMLFMVLYLIGLISLGAAGWEDPLYYFGRTSATPYSDMNGYGGLLGFASWYTLYWTFFAVLLGVVAYLLWDRGPLEKLRIRIGNMRANATRATGIIAAVAATGFIATFVWLFYNTHVLNEYVTSDDIRAAQAEYESRFIKWKDHPIPRVTDVSIEVDLYPSENSFEVRGKYVLENKTDAAISTVPLGFAIDVDITELAIPGGEISETDERYNFHVFEFSPAIEPGEERTLTYTGRRTRTGYKHRRNVQGLLSGGGVFGNGTFVNSGALGPYIGFNTGAILSDRNDRWREDLEPLPRFADLDDESAWGNSYLTQDADWISFKATVTTSADQIAIAPGYLIEETEEGNRRRYVYEMDAPMQNFYAVLSARYASRVEEWNDTQLAVFYEPEHEWNVDRIITSLKDSISYFNENFSQYQYRQMRVLEFPAYANFAQSFPNTVPWSEGLGFIADITDPEDIDYVYYVGAHEVAHQWWGHQVSSANVQGQTTLVETLAQYSALMVMEHEYGPHMMRRFLKYELDNYLSNRGGEAIEEMPLYRVENQGYIHYRKGAIVMYALKDYIGEEAINHALKTLIEEVAYRFDPYPTSRDLLRNLRAVATTDAQQDLITDMFERITIWDMKVAEATAAERDDGRFDVTINVTAAKFEADGEGQQVEVPLDMPIDIGIFTENPDKVFEGEEHVLLFEKHPIRSGEAEFTFVVDEMPTHVGIDPYNKLIDRNSDDNIDTVN